MIEALTRYEALLACRDKAGSDSQLARDLGTNQPRIWRMINQSKQMHEDFVLMAADLYGIPPFVLRPDLYPRNLAQRFYGVDQHSGRAA